MKTKKFLSMLAMVLTITLSSLLLTACSGRNDDEPQTPSGRDEFSNTSWKLVSITGYGAGDSSNWRGEILSFGPDGSVTEKYVEGGSETGSYSLNNGSIRFSGLGAWTNSWGSSFSYNISGQTMTLNDDLGSMGSTFKFTKL